MNDILKELLELLEEIPHEKRVFLYKSQHQKDVFEEYGLDKKYRFQMAGEDVFELTVWNKSDPPHEQRISKEEYDTLKQAFYGESKNKG